MDFFTSTLVLTLSKSETARQANSRLAQTKHQKRATVMSRLNVYKGGSINRCIKGSHWDISSIMAIVKSNIDQIMTCKYE